MMTDFLFTEKGKREQNHACFMFDFREYFVDLALILPTKYVGFSWVCNLQSIQNSCGLRAK